MQAATASELPHDRVCNWYDELARIVTVLPSLSPQARGAVSNVLVSLRHEAEFELTAVQAQGLDDILAALCEPAAAKTQRAPGGALRFDRPLRLQVS